MNSLMQKNNIVDQSSNLYTGTRIQTEGAVFVVYRQPMALDRFAVHDVRPSDTSGMAKGVMTCTRLLASSKLAVYPVCH
jgi:hypothetical protein